MKISRRIPIIISNVFCRRGSVLSEVFSDRLFDFGTLVFMISSQLFTRRILVSMLQNHGLGQGFFFGCLVWFALSGSVLANNARQLLVVTESVVFVPKSIEGAGQARDEKILFSAGTVVVGTVADDSRYGHGVDGFCEVMSTEATPRAGQVLKRCVMPLSDYAEQLIAQREKIDKAGDFKTFHRPTIINFQENPAVAKAWDKVNELVAANEKLAERQQLPEPYFARAELWAAVENYSDAIQDYITGIGISRRRGASPSYYLQYVEKLGEAVRQLDANPVPASGVKVVRKEAAVQHFQLGYTAFFMNDYEKSRMHFTNCVTMDPEQPHYWYFRALSQWELGNRQQAQHDALLGAKFEQSLATDAISMDQRLFRVQGARRTWLEKYRNGLMAFHILGPNKVSLSHPSSHNALENNNTDE